MERLDGDEESWFELYLQAPVEDPSDDGPCGR